MAIKQVLEVAAQGELFAWFWIERKPGIFFLKLATAPSTPAGSVFEVYGIAEAVEFTKRLIAAGGVVDHQSLLDADTQHRYFLAMRDGTHPDAVKEDA